MPRAVLDAESGDARAGIELASPRVDEAELLRLVAKYRALALSSDPAELPPIAPEPAAPLAADAEFTARMVAVMAQTPLLTPAAVLEHAPLPQPASPGAVVMMPFAGPVVMARAPVRPSGPPPLLYAVDQADVAAAAAAAAGASRQHPPGSPQSAPAPAGPPVFRATRVLEYVLPVAQLAAQD
jgi:hypothetical protein